MRHATIIISLLCVVTLSSHAAIYTWKDENGRTVYSQTPQPGAEKKTLKPVPMISGESSESDAKSDQKGNDAYLKEIEQSNAARDKAREDARKAALEKAEKKKACATVRSNLEALNQGGDRRFRQPDGTYSYYSQQKRAEEREKLQSYIRENCN